MKANLDYVVRSVTAPGETEPTLVPVLVNRLPSRALAAVISNAIKNNLIAGLQESAVSGIAAGLADQIYDTLREGRGVRFGSYFYVRPYLTGLTDANGTLTRKGNGIDATIVAGPDFALTLDDFSLHFTGRDAQPRVDSVKYNGEGSDNGLVVKGGKVLVNGILLVVSESDDAKVTFAGAEGAVEVTDFDAKGAQLLEFGCPAALVAGKTYAVQVSRSDGSGNVRVSNTKRVTVRDGAEPVGPAPEIEEGISAASSEEGDHKVYGADADYSLYGSNLTGATVTLLWEGFEGNVPADKAEIASDGTSIRLDGENLTAMMLDAEHRLEPGGAITFKVTTPGGVAEYQTERAE